MLDAGGLGERLPLPRRRDQRAIASISAPPYSYCRFSRSTIRLADSSGFAVADARHCSDLPRRFPTV
jgi:hypothetical protein